MKYPFQYENAIAGRGNLFRLKRAMERAMAGEKIRLGFLGGSITQGSLAAKPEFCYSYRVYEWWKEQFPASETQYFNAGIGGTTSEFGAARVKEDLLKYEPDVVFVEFSVNDEATEHFAETYEGLVRRILKEKNAPAVMLIHNVYYHNGANAQVFHARVGRHYNLPSVSMQSCIYPEVAAGRIANRDITPDDLHPNDLGHEMIASVIAYFLEKVKEEILQGRGSSEEQKELCMPNPLSRNEAEHSYRFRNDNCNPKCFGFTADETPQRDITDCFKRGWMAKEEGEAISFRIKGSGIAVQYRKSVQKPAPIAAAVIDGDREHAILLDANFDENWGDKLELQTLLWHGEDKEHTIEIQIQKGGKECVVPFYLVSIIAMGKSNG